VDDLLSRRRSEKWTKYPADVLPAFVAEMDFALAPAVKAALHAAIDNDDLGYIGQIDGLLEAFCGFMQRRLGWTVNPAEVTLITDVMVGVEELLLELTAPGDGVIVNPPVYHPYFVDIPHARRRVVEVPLLASGALDVDGIASAFAAGARALLLCNPHNPTGRVPSLLPPGVRVAVPPQASFLTWLDCRAAGLGEDPAAAFLERGRVALESGLRFGSQGAGFARLNVGTTPELLDEAVRRLAAALTP
jgi:bifunctional pyridoxal-dependent enzyme with beta-cystathionase and maltose regulon repressor activities